MGTHPIFESDFDCLTDFVSSQKITVTKNRAMKKPDAHTVNMPPDVRGDDSVENVSTVILTLVQALLLIREHTDRAWNLEQKKTEREEGKRMKGKETRRICAQCGGNFGAHPKPDCKGTRPRDCTRDWRKHLQPERNVEVQTSAHVDCQFRACQV